jgi:hypothetical protein
MRTLRRAGATRQALVRLTAHIAAGSCQGQPAVLGGGAADTGGPCRVLRDIAITMLGLIALFTPLLLWTAWSQAMFWLILAVGSGAVVAIFLLIRLFPDRTS